MANSKKQITENPVTVSSHFDNNIKPYILEELAKANHSIFVASAWFTDRNLAELLLNKHKKGIFVELIIDDNDENKKTHNLDTIENLYKNGINVYIATGFDGGQMHHKFCIIDLETVITGSYNWTKKASTHNKENIVIIKDKKEANEFYDEFELLRKNATPLIASEKIISIRFFADKYLVEKEGTVTLNWEVSNADRIEIDTLGEVADKGKQALIIDNNTLITLSAENTTTEKKAKRFISIEVIKEPKIQFSISGNDIVRTKTGIHIARTQSARLKWRVHNAEKITITPNIGVVENQGELIINPFSSTTYTLTAIGNVSTMVRYQAINVHVFPTPVMERLLIPTPANIRIASTIDLIKKEIPTMLPLSDNIKFPYYMPKLRSLKMEYAFNNESIEQEKNDAHRHQKEHHRLFGKMEYHKFKNKILHILSNLFSTKPTKYKKIN